MGVGGRADPTADWGATSLPRIRWIRLRWAVPSRPPLDAPCQRPSPIGAPSTVNAQRGTAERASEPVVRHPAVKLSVRLRSPTVRRRFRCRAGAMANVGVDAGISAGPACARPRTGTGPRRPSRTPASTSTSAAHPRSWHRTTRAPICAAIALARPQATSVPRAASPAAARAARSAAASARCRATVAPPRSSAATNTAVNTATEAAAQTVAAPRSDAPTVGPERSLMAARPA